MEKNKVYSSLSLLCFNLFIASLVLVVCSYFSILSLDVLFNSDIIFGVGMFLGFISLVLWEKSKGNWEFHLDHKDKKKIKEVPKADDNLFFKIVPYLFLLMLLIIAANQFFKWEFVTAQMMRITILAITFGAITFWRNRDRVEKEIEREKEDEEQAELTRANEFDSKFPRLSKLNIDYGFIYAGKIKSLFRRFLVYLILAIFAPLIFLIRTPYKFVKWMYKEGWSFSILFVLIALVFITIKIGVSVIYNGSYIDEYNHIFSGIEFFKTGHFYSLDVTSGSYLKGTYLSILVGLFLKLFGHSIFIAKLVPALIGGINFILLYFIAKKVIYSKKYILLLLVIYSFSPWVIFNQFYIRTYVFFEFFALLIGLFFLNLQVKKNKLPTLIFILSLIVIIYLFSFDVSMWLIIIFTFLNMGYFLLLNKKFLFNKWQYSIILGIIAFILIVGIIRFQDILFLLQTVFSNAPPQGYDYMTFFFEWNTIISIFFVIAIISLGKLNKNNLLLFSVFGLFAIHLFSPKYLQVTRAIFYLIPFFYLISINSICQFKKAYRGIFILLLILALVQSYPSNFLSGPYIPGEIDYMGTGTIYADIHTICINKTIITSNEPAVLIFNNISVDYKINNDLSAKVNRTILEINGTWVDTYSKILIIQNLSQLLDLASKEGVCYIERSQTANARLGGEIKEYIYKNFYIYGDYSGQKLFVRNSSN